MGQAKARGSKDQRVAEAVERAKAMEAAANARLIAERKAEAEALAVAQVAREKENAERRERGEEPLSTYVRVGQRKMRLSALLAVAGIAMMANSATR